MSRGFVKEEDQEKIPMVSPRADLPQGVTNYVTQHGLQLLLEERETLITTKNSEITANENERRIEVNYINAKLTLLSERIATAKVVDMNNQSPNEIRFGAYVTLKINNKKQLERYQIVGVDEATILQNKIAFISPIAKLLINKKVGDQAILALANTSRTFEILSIEYKK